jgi:hypothetical protein
MNFCVCEDSPSDADGAPESHFRFLCIANQESKARSALLALCNQVLVAPDAALKQVPWVYARFTGFRQDERLVAPGVPPATHTRNHFGDAIVGRVCGGLGVEEIRERDFRLGLLRRLGQRTGLV